MFRDMNTSCMCCLPILLKMVGNHIPTLTLYPLCSSGLFQSRPLFLVTPLVLQLRPCGAASLNPRGIQACTVQSINPRTIAPILPPCPLASGATASVANQCTHNIALGVGIQFMPFTQALKKLLAKHRGSWRDLPHTSPTRDNPHPQFVLGARWLSFLTI